MGGVGDRGGVSQRSCDSIVVPGEALRALRYDGSRSSSVGQRSTVRNWGDQLRLSEGTANGHQNNDALQEERGINEMSTRTSHALDATYELKHFDRVVMSLLC